MTNQPTPPPAATTPPPATTAPPPTTPALEPIDESPQHPMRRAMLWVARILTWLLNAYIIIVEIILLLGFLLLLGGANPSSSFVQWAYRNLDRAMKPFRGIFEPIEIGTTSGDVPAVVETSVLFAMIVYGIVLIVVQALMQWLNSRVARLDREDEEYRRQQLADRRMAAMRQQAAYTAATQPTPATTASQPAVTQPTATQPTATQPTDTVPTAPTPPTPAPPTPTGQTPPASEPQQPPSTPPSST